MFLIFSIHRKPRTLTSWRCGEECANIFLLANMKMSKREANPCPRKPRTTCTQGVRGGGHLKYIISSLLFWLSFCLFCVFRVET